MMHMRKPALPTRSPKRFAPEAYGNFPVVAPERIADLRARMANEMEGEEWEVVEDVALTHA